MRSIEYNSNIVYGNIKYENAGIPITAFLKITNRCMMKCSFCSQKNNLLELDLEKAKIVLKKLHKSGVLRIFYTGGEPFLYSNFYELLKFGKRLGFYQLVISNGYILDLIKSKKCLDYIDSLSISLHGKKETHNSIIGLKAYDKIIQNICDVKKQYPNLLIDVCYTVNEENADREDILSVANFCKNNNFELTITRTYNIEEGIKYNNFKYVDKVLDIISDLKKHKYKVQVGHCISSCSIKQSYKYLCSYCSAGINFFAIDINGDVKICSNSIYPIGNIFKSSINSIIKSMNSKLNKHLKELPITCKNCESYNSCLGGCKCENGKMENGLVDNLAIVNLNKRWNSIKDNIYKPHIAAVTRNGSKYALIGQKTSFINKKGYNILNNLNFDLSLNDNLNLIKDKNINRIKELLIMLCEDGFLVRK